MPTEPPERQNQAAARPVEVDQLVNGFKAAWTSVSPVGEIELTSYLPPLGHAQRPVALRKLVLADLKLRLQHGEAPTLESYIRRYPELGPDPSVELILGDYRVRRSFDRHIDISSYRERFPGQYAQLEALDRTLVANPSVTGSGPSRSDYTSTMRPPAPSTPQEPPASVGDTTPTGTYVDTSQDAPIVSDDSLGPGSIPPPPSWQAEETNSTSRDTSSEPAGDNDSRRTASSSYIQTEGGYELKERLGSGQFGEVWSAEAPGGVDVAVKIISFPANHKTTQLELQSLEVMKKLRHPFLLQVQAYWLHDDQLHIVMERGDETLQDLAARYSSRGEEVPVQTLLEHLREACEAVDFLHSENVLHRDIKPANILLVSGHIKVADFGIARVFGERNISVTATTMGTPLYMAPEVWRGRASSQSDLYSLAMTYAELRMGRPPYSGKSLAAVMTDHLEHSPNLDRLLENERKVVSKALSKDPETRQATCSQFASELQAAVAADTTPDSEATTKTPMSRVAGVVAGLLVVAAIAFALLYPRDPSGDPTVVPPVVEVPQQIENMAPVEAAGHLRVGGQLFWQQLTWTSPAGNRAEFILIPQSSPDSPSTCYVMKTKVTSQLFGEFANAEGTTLDPRTQWELGGQAGGKDLGVEEHPEHPVYRMHISDAEAFARWLHPLARLPSAEQWDVASGAYSEWEFEGPFNASLESIRENQDSETPADMIAFGRMESGPLPSGTASADVSIYGCRDMSGNGMEWTRTSIENITYRSENELPQGSFVKLRGGPYRYGGPFVFGTEISEDRDFVSPEIGFRVVLEVTGGEY